MRPLLAYAAGELTARRPSTRRRARRRGRADPRVFAHPRRPALHGRRRPAPRASRRATSRSARRPRCSPATRCSRWRSRRSRTRPGDARRHARVLADAAGALGMAGGQAIDLAARGAHAGRGALAAMHRHEDRRADRRGGAARRARAGARSTPAESAALDRFVDAAGLAFQVVDDVLDVEGSSATLGKTAGKDAAQGKPTFVSALGPRRGAQGRGRAPARRRAQRRSRPSAPAARRLRELADWIVLRSS